jgi:malate synthase
MDSHFGKIALDIFKKENQLENKLTYLAKYPDLIASPAGPKTMHGLRFNTKLCLKYISSYLQGEGTFILDNNIEDLSSFEISRAQLWQWKKHSALLESTEVVSEDLLDKVIEDECEEIHREIQASIPKKEHALVQEEYLATSKDLFKKIIFSEELDSYFTDYIAKDEILD